LYRYLYRRITGRSLTTVVTKKRDILDATIYDEPICHRGGHRKLLSIHLLALVTEENALYSIVVMRVSHINNLATIG
jgi:hypothetical protein